jgi:hypothetical protein
VTHPFSVGAIVGAKTDNPKEDVMTNKTWNLTFGLAALALAVLPAGTAPQPGSSDKDTIPALVRTLDVGRPVHHEGLTIVPVYSRKVADGTDYPTLEEAVKFKWVEITEVEGGRVPQAKISNLSKHVLFLMAGEILSGARQDRILAQDVLLSPGTRDLVVPVFCVEQGRWTPSAMGFTSKSNLGTASLRAKAVAQAPAAQSRIWEEVQAQNERLDVASGSGAYQAAFEKKENQDAIAAIERKMKGELRLAEDTVGVVIGLGGRIVSVDIFANPQLFKKEWPKILKASALSSLQARKPGELGQNGAADFLKGLAGKEFRRKPALDLGFELEASDGTVLAKALVTKTAVIHFAAFPQEEGGKGFDTPEQRIPVIRDFAHRIR